MLGTLPSHHPLDLGIIASLKRSYKRRLLELLVSFFESTRRIRAVVRASPAASSAAATEATADSDVYCERIYCSFPR